MPIKGLTDRAPQFPSIGELRKGEKKPNEKQPGRDLGEYFRFTSKDEAVAADFGAVYGDRPASIHVYLPFASAAENFGAWQEEWVAGGLKHRCDGETCVLWYDDKAAKYHTDPKPCPGKCGQVGRLRVIVPELKRLAYVTVLTTSKNDISKLTENLLAYESLRGDLRGIPFVLHRALFNISTPQRFPKGHPQAGQLTGKRERRDKWLLTIEPMPQWVELQLTAQEQAATPLLEARAGGVIVDATTGEIIRGNGGGPEWFEDDEEIPEEGAIVGDGRNPEPAPPEPEPPKDTKRPMTAEQVRGVWRKHSGAWVKGNAGDWSDAVRDDTKLSQPSDKQIGAAASLMAAVVAVDGLTQTGIDNARHAVLAYCIGVEHTSQLSSRECSAVIELWKGGESWEPNEWARAEAAAVVTAHQKQAGQLDLLPPL